MMDCIFCKIATREIPTDFVYEDDDVVAFRDIHPKKPVHVLIVPKTHIPNLISLDDNTTMDGIRKAMQKIIADQGIEAGYKVEINGGVLQEVAHLHVHLLGPYKS